MRGKRTRTVHRVPVCVAARGVAGCMRRLAVASNRLHGNQLPSNQLPGNQQPRVAECMRACDAIECAVRQQRACLRESDTESATKARVAS